MASKNKAFPLRLPKIIVDLIDESKPVGTSRCEQIVTCLSQSFEQEMNKTGLPAEGPIVKFTIRVPDSLADRLIQMAQESGRSRNNEVAYRLANMLVIHGEH